MSRFVFCGICDTNLGVLFERDAEDDAPTLDFLPHDDCWHVSRQQLVEDLEALHSGESSLPVSLKRIAAGARQLSLGGAGRQLKTIAVGIPSTICALHPRASSLVSPHSAWTAQLALSAGRRRSVAWAEVVRVASVLPI